MGDNWGESDFVRGVALPKADIPVGFTHQSYQHHEFGEYRIGVSAYGIQMGAGDLERALQNPEQFIQALQYVSDTSSTLYYGDTQDAPKRHVVKQGLIAFDDGGIIRGGERGKHITIISEQRNATGFKTCACTHYIELGAHFDAIAGQSVMLGESIADLIKQVSTDEIRASVKATETSLQYIDERMERVKDKERRLKYKQMAAERKIAKANLKERPRQRNGYVYLLHAHNDLYKIGRTVNPNNRLKTFNVKLPFEVEYVCLIQCPDMYALETALHSKFADKRVNGEWFNLCTDDVAYIQSLAS